MIPGTETVLSEWSEDVFQFFDPAKAPTELQTSRFDLDLWSFMGDNIDL